MAKFVGTPLRGFDFSSVADEALSARVHSDNVPRIRIDAGGKITWGSGSAAGDTNLYRSAGNFLTTDDVFKATGGVITLTTNGPPNAALENGALAIDITNDDFYFRSQNTWTKVSGNASISVSETAPPDAESGAMWFDSTSLELFIYYGSAWVQLNADTGAEELSDLLDIEFNNLIAGQILKYDGEKWVNETGSSTTVSDTAPTNAASGDLWYDSTNLGLFIYYGGNWVELNPDTGVEELSDLFDVNLTSPTNGQVLKYNGTEWVNAADNAGTSISSINDINDVTITSVANGQVLKWNGSAWVNATDNAGTTINSLDDVGDVTITSAANGQFLKWNGTAWVNASIPAINTLDDINDVTISNVAVGQSIQWNGTAWVNTTQTPVSISDTSPASPTAGSLWFESDTGAMFVYYDSHWIEISGGTVTGGGGGGGSTDEGSVAMISSWMVGSN